jgi:lipopolysaccharide assembly outer membrane protein LptD (OstA)
MTRRAHQFDSKLDAHNQAFTKSYTTVENAYQQLHLNQKEMTKIQLTFKDITIEQMQLNENYSKVLKIAYDNKKEMRFSIQENQEFIKQNEAMIVDSQRCVERLDLVLGNLIECVHLEMALSWQDQKDREATALYGA